MTPFVRAMSAVVWKDLAAEFRAISAERNSAAFH